MTRRLRAGQPVLVAIGLLMVSMGAGEQCMATERTQYSVLVSEAPFEIRDYGVSVVATVAVDGSRSDAVNSGFRILAGYIFGQNQRKSKIAMTAPVTQIPSDTRAIEGSTSLPTVNSWIVRFMMPAGYRLESLPDPLDTRIHFEQLPGHRVAAVRFSGFWSDDNLRSHESRLRGWLRTRHLAATSAATFAYYDAPWTPWFMRNNEVLIDVAPAS